VSEAILVLITCAITIFLFVFLSVWQIKAFQTAVSSTLESLIDDGYVAIDNLYIDRRGKFFSFFLEFFSIH
jgi:DNA-binding transcriptional regulator of glucitol operon